MALSGSYYEYPTSSFGLYVEWFATQNLTGNYSKVTQRIYLSYYTLEIAARSDSTSSINGAKVTYTSPSIYDYSDGWKKKLLYTHTETVSHDNDGTKNNVALSASWRFSGTYSGVAIGTITASATINLDPIDRSAPLVSFVVSNITANSFKISASSSVTADKWWYSIDGGSNWTTFGSNGTHNDVVVNWLFPNTSYKVQVSARKKTNAVEGYSAKKTVKTLGGAVINSVSTVKADDTTVNVTMGLTVYDSSFYHKLSIKNGSTEILTTDAFQFSSSGTSSRTKALTASERTVLLNAMANMRSFTATLSLATYSNAACTTQVGSASTKTCTITTTESISKPTFTDFSYVDSRGLVGKLTGSTEDNVILIQSCSSLVVTAVAGTAKNGASIKSYSASIGDASKTSSSTTISVGGIGNYGDSMALTVSCIDSRGYATSVTKSVKVLKYEKPKLQSVTVRRKDEIEDIVQLEFNGTISSLKPDGNTERNSLKYAGFYYKKTTDETWSSWYSIKNSVTANGTSFSFSTDQLMLNSTEALSFDTETSYDFHLLIRDQLDYYASYDDYFTVPQGKPIVSLRKKNSTYNFPRVGINNPNPTEALDVVGNVMMNGVYVLGFVGMVSGSFGNYTKGGLYSYTATETISDAPGKAGMLEVLADGRGYVIQKFTEFKDGSKMFLRSFNPVSKSWTAWAEK